jgi:hypothetical protein
MMKKTRLLSAVLWASLMTPALVLASGCQLGCTQAGCASGVSIDIQGLEPDQAYNVNVETPDESIKCNIPAGVDMDGFRSMICDDATILFSDEYGALLELQDTPARVEVTVRQGEAVVAHQDVEPTYRRSAPNGEQCGPICHHADIPVEL